MLNCERNKAGNLLIDYPIISLASSFARIMKRWVINLRKTERRRRRARLSESIDTFINIISYFSGEIEINFFLQCLRLKFGVKKKRARHLSEKKRRL